MNPYTKGLKRVRRAWAEGYMAGLRKARFIAKANIVAAEWDHVSAEFEDFDEQIDKEIAKTERDT